MRRKSKRARSLAPGLDFRLLARARQVAWCTPQAAGHATGVKARPAPARPHPLFFPESRGVSFSGLGGLSLPRALADLTG
ncbi:hypothetical protein GUJ93_ZPchr0010g9850 [Zizania palustris]|uniref:Uncharacterized protein n=1 Tax=Zizania palustris TaxID=103762 RepID=A0A8J5WC13_ZIZPA|nr:hypothetical protein GUJ93_ZPchr0010g9850 [Zizania palustris]